MIPILPVRDMAAATDFWSRTGVSVEPYDDGYALVRAGHEEVAHLRLVPDLEPARNAAACYLHVADPDDVRARWAAAGLPVSAVRVEPWGMREFWVLDPSGNRLRVGCQT